jgi:hypothetical protein
MGPRSAALADYFILDTPLEPDSAAHHAEGLGAIWRPRLEGLTKRQITGLQAPARQVIGLLELRKTVYVLDKSLARQREDATGSRSPAILVVDRSRQGEVGPQRRLRLVHGDVVVRGGPARRVFHDVDRLKAGDHSMTGAFRYNPTFRHAFAATTEAVSSRKRQPKNRRPLGRPNGHVSVHVHAFRLG